MKKLICSMLCLLAVITGVISVSAGEMPPLFASIEKGDVDTIAELADSSSVNQMLEIGDDSITPLGFVISRLDLDVEKAQSIIILLLKQGADPNVVYNNHVPGSATDWAMAVVMMSSGSDEKSDVYQSILNSLKQYGGHVNADRLAAIQEKLLDFKRKASLASCTADARNWMAEQEAFHREHKTYPSRPNKLPGSLNLISYRYGMHSFSATLSCKLVADSNWVTYRSESDMQPNFR